MTLPIPLPHHIATRGGWGLYLSALHYPDGLTVGWREIATVRPLGAPPWRLETVRLTVVLVLASEVGCGVHLDGRGKVRVWLRLRGPEVDAAAVAAGWPVVVE